jgi:hypothetical protein
MKNEEIYGLTPFFPRNPTATTAICDFVTRVLRVLPGIQNTNTATIF